MVWCLVAALFSTHRMHPSIPYHLWQPIISSCLQTLVTVQGGRAKPCPAENLWTRGNWGSSGVWMAWVPWRTLCNQGTSILPQGSEFQKLATQSRPQGSCLQDLSPCFNQLSCDLLSGLRENERGENQGDVGLDRGIQESHSEDQARHSFQHAKAGPWGLSQAQERPSNLWGMCVFFNILSTELVTKLSKWNEKISRMATGSMVWEDSFFISYVLWFFSSAFQRAFLQASILYCSACTLRKDKYFQCVFWGICSHWENVSLMDVAILTSLAG